MVKFIGGGLCWNAVFRISPVDFLNSGGQFPERRKNETPQRKPAQRDNQQRKIGKQLQKLNRLGQRHGLVSQRLPYDIAGVFNGYVDNVSPGRHFSSCRENNKSPQIALVEPELGPQRIQLDPGSIAQIASDNIEDQNLTHGAFQKSPPVYLRKGLCLAFELLLEPGAALIVLAPNAENENIGRLSIDVIPSNCRILKLPVFHGGADFVLTSDGLILPLILQSFDAGAHIHQIGASQNGDSLLRLGKLPRYLICIHHLNLPVFPENAV